MKNISAILFFFFLYCLTTLSQNPEWLNYTNGDEIQTMVRDGDYIWVGTGRGGLVKIDRLSGISLFWRKLNSGLPSNSIRSIVIDASDNKWIGTEEGLAKFDGVNWTVYNTSNSGLPSNSVSSIIIDASDNKWIGTGAGLAKFDDINWEIFTG